MSGPGANGRKVNDINKDGWNSLMVASQRGNWSVVCASLENKADVYLKNQEGLTALHLAAMNNRAEVTKLLIHGGSKVNDIDREGRTPLMVALGEGNTNVTDILRDHTYRYMLTNRWEDCSVCSS